MKRLYICLVASALCGNSFAAFTAYNDCSYSTTRTGKVTGFQAGDTSVLTSGLLKNYSTGLETTVTATLTWNGCSMTTGTGAASGAGDEAIYFPAAYSGDGLALAGTVSYSTGSEATWWVDLTFTGLNPLAKYEFATTANRNSTTYTDRFTKFTIVGADSATNGSSTGTAIDNLTTVFCTGYNPNGNVARWTNIVAGADGTFTIHFGVNSATSAGGRGYGPSVFLLGETDAVPEPASILLLGLGIIPVIRRRRK